VYEGATPVFLDVEAATWNLDPELLRQELLTIALNVNQHNAPAIRVYERLGFVRYCEFIEGLAEPL